MKKLEKGTQESGIVLEDVLKKKDFYLCGEGIG
jgi:hypothetical protein